MKCDFRVNDKQNGIQLMGNLSILARQNELDEKFSEHCSNAFSIRNSGCGHVHIHSQCAKYNFRRQKPIQVVIPCANPVSSIFSLFRIFFSFDDAFVACNAYSQRDHVQCSLFERERLSPCIVQYSVLRHVLALGRIYTFCGILCVQNAPSFECRLFIHFVFGGHQSGILE